MIVQKVRGKNKIKPIRVSQIECKIIENCGMSIEKYVTEYVKLIAKRRKWKWYFKNDK